MGVERAGGRDADAGRGREAVSGGLGAHLGDHLDDPGDDRLDAVLVVGRLSTAAVDRSVRGDERGTDLGAAEVDRQDRALGCVLHDESF